MLDYKRKFIEAASRYNELSYKTIIHEDERMTALKNAMICTILASAGWLSFWLSLLSALATVLSAHLMKGCSFHL